MTSFPLITVGSGVLLLSLFSVRSLETAPATPDSDSAVTFAAVEDGLAAENRYVGQKVCKNCHSGDDKGGVHEKWADSPHAKAYETLGTDAAKKAAKELGIDNPQEAKECLQCHVTAYGVDEKLIKRGFKMEDGVQCETCHGPGEDHFKARFKASQKGGDEPIPEGEIKAERSPELCKQCHNEKSPTYKEFCFKERMAQIEHLDPRKERSEEELKAMREMCTPDCPKCSKEKEGEEK
jgi:hypothetical protein